MDEIDEQLAKVRVELHDDQFEFESLWAKPLGEDLYLLRNTPFLAFDLHFGDVVRAVSDGLNEPLRVVEVVRSGGHKTLRMRFTTEVSEQDRLKMLQLLNGWRCFFENGDGEMYALNVEPDGNYGAVCDRLYSWEQAGRLHYETGTTSDKREINPTPRWTRIAAALLDVFKRQFGRSGR